jgi:hypothetical protein
MAEVRLKLCCSAAAAAALVRRTCYKWLYRGEKEESAEKYCLFKQILPIHNVGVLKSN